MPLWLCIPSTRQHSSSQGGQEEPGVPVDLAVSAAGRLFVHPKYGDGFCIFGEGEREDVISEFYFQC